MSTGDVQSWVTQAKRDLEMAEVLLEREYWDGCIFHAQQAAEKAIKALYIATQGTLAPKTHNVERIAQELGAPQTILNSAGDLTAEYMASRYPDSMVVLPGSYTEADAKSRLADARNVCDWAFERI